MVAFISNWSGNLDGVSFSMGLPLSNSESDYGIIRGLFQVTRNFLYLMDISSSGKPRASLINSSYITSAFFKNGILN